MVESEHFEFHIHDREADLLAPYMVEAGRGGLGGSLRALPASSLRRPFGWRSIRRMPTSRSGPSGLAGLGALGVCFGPVVALDSPSARQVGHFNWGGTLWHEIAHTFTLLLTDAKIPRWLTEGLSVFEERRARPGWGDDVQVGFLTALRDGELLGMARINDGFVRPKFPNQIALSYFQASLIVEWIDEHYGFDAILRMLAGYRGGRSTEEAFREAMSLSLDDFDERFFGHLRERFGGAMAALGDAPPESGEEEEDSGEGGPSRAPTRNPFERGEPDLEQLALAAKQNPDDFRIQMTYGSALFREERFAEAEEPLLRGRDLFPEYVGAGNAYTLLAEIYRRQEREEDAIEALMTLVASNETAWDEHLALAGLLGAAGRDQEEAGILERSLYISPYDLDVHRRLAELASASDRLELAVRERAALVALDRARPRGGALRAGPGAAPRRPDGERPPARC